MISPGGRPINEAPLSSSKTDNWVARVGGLPPYIRGVARGIAKKHGGKVTSRDIKIAVARMKVWAAGGGGVRPQVRAAAAAAVADWEAKRAKAHSLSNAPRDVIDLAAAGGHHIKGTAYHWFHGWHARDRSTALQYNKKADLKGLEKSGAKFHNVEPEEFNNATSKTPKFIGGNDTPPVMKYRKNKLLHGTKHIVTIDPKKGHALGNHKIITVAGVSESNTHVIDTEGKKHKITGLTGKSAADSHALSEFQKKKYKTAIKDFQIKSGFAPAPKPFKLKAGKATPFGGTGKLPESKKNVFTADPHDFGEPDFPASKSLNEPNVEGGLSGLTVAEKAALKSYTGSGYATINNQLRHHQVEGEPVHPTVQALDKAIAKATPLNELAPGHLHRGFNVAALAGLQPGDSFVDKGFVSTSRRHQLAQGFGGGTTRIHIETAHPDLKALDVFGISQHPSEAEVLLPRNTKFTVKRRVEHGGHSHLYVHAEPANAVVAKPKKVKVAA